MPMARDWHGMSIRHKTDRAAARALVGIGMEVARETKLVTHRISGTLARSVHAAPVGYEYAAEDARDAVEHDLLLREALHPTPLPTGPAIEVGSWLPYACVEWVGRGHPGVTQGLEIGRAKTDRYVRQAMREEGL